MSATISKHTPPPSAAGRWFLAVMGLSIALLGALFVWLMGRSFLRAKEMRAWPEVPCTILVSELEERQHDENSPPEFRQSLVFGYEWQGEGRTGTHISLRENPWSSKQAEMLSRMEQYPVGMTTTCRVSPKDPNFAILKPDSLAPGYSIWFPFLFVVGGLGITFRAALNPSQRKKV